MSGETWACAVCTYINPASFDKCEMCGTGNPAGPSLDSIPASVLSPDGGIACHICTFVNPITAIKCAMCETVLQKPADLDTSPWMIGGGGAGGMGMDMGMSMGMGMDGDSSGSDLQILDAAGRMEFSSMFGPFDRGIHTAPPPPMMPAAVKSKSKSRSRTGHGKSSRSSRAPAASGDDASSSSIFKDVSEILAKEEGESERIAKEEKNVHLLKELYDSAYPVHTLKKEGSLDEIKKILSELAQFVPREENDDSIDAATEAASCAGTDCQVCLRPARAVTNGTDEYAFAKPDATSDTCVLVHNEDCGHKMICQSCLIAYSKEKIEADDVTPWIRCAAPGCRTPLHPKHMTRLLDLADVYKFVAIFLRKHLKRNPNWIPCTNEDCEYGFIMLKRDSSSSGDADGCDDDGSSDGPPSSSSSSSSSYTMESVMSMFGSVGGGGGGSSRSSGRRRKHRSSSSSSSSKKKKKGGGSKKVRCEACGKKQTISRDPVKGDKGFADLIKDGTLRLCPKCEFPTMKDKGMCNVMKCGQCGIWWNWRSRETGTSYHDLKNKARMSGTLWEPGELSYQQKLQRSDPEAFRLLLERNGIPYDPSYVRGT